MSVYGVSSSLAAEGESGRSLVLSGVTIVDTDTGALTPDMALRIENGQISALLPAAELAADDSVNRVDARGKYVVPGYLDLHAHTADWSDPVQSAKLMLSHGITGYRQMSGSSALLQQRREGRIAPFPDAPSMLAMPGLVLIEQFASTPEMAVAQVRQQQADGADFIKVADLPADIYMAALAAATDAGLPYAGHLPSTINVIDAAAAGMRSIEHLGPRSSILLSCSSDEAALRQSIAESPPDGIPVLPDFLVWLLSPVIETIMERVLVNPTLLGDKREFALMQRVVDTYSESKCRTLAAALANSVTWQVPTLIRVRTMEMGDAPEYRNDPHLNYVAARDRELWASVGADFADDISAADKATLKQFFALLMKLTALFDQAGVKMLAGSDTGGAGWVVPGFSLHQEFDLLEQAGVPPLHVLQMTTRNGAEFLGQTNMGSVAVGKEANLVLLDSNPIASVQNLHGIHAVVRNGNYYSATALKELQNAQ